MNSLLNYVENNKLIVISFLLLILLIVIGIFIFIIHSKDKFSQENHSNLNSNQYTLSSELSNSFSRVPSHIEKLPLQQMTQVSQVSPVSPVSPVSGDKSDAPNYGKTSEPNTPENTKMIPGNIYRMNTGREAYQQEEFVSIYDSNFGGLLGTSMGTSMEN